MLNLKGRGLEDELCFLFYFLKELQLILSEICYECDAPSIVPCFSLSLSSARAFCIAALLVYFSVLGRN